MKKIYLLSLSLLLLIATSCQTKSIPTSNKEIIDTSASLFSNFSSSKEYTQVTTSSTNPISEEVVQIYLNKFEQESIGISIKDIKTGKYYGVNDYILFYGASIAKLPIIYYTQEQLKNQKIYFETTYLYTDEVNDIPGAMIRGGTGIMQNKLNEQREFTVEELLAWTIKYSDNLASNMLSFYVADKNGNSFEEIISPFYSFEQTVYSKNMTAITATNLMEAIYINKIGLDYFNQTEWQKEKIGILDKQTFHKIGTNGDFNHDVGVVDGKNPYIISILTENYSNNEIEDIIKNIDYLLDGGEINENM